jgi:RimJ/RimL family protein N-acetyltransferase
VYSTGGTTIRAVEADDLAATRRWRNDPRISGPALGRRFPITEVGERNWFEQLGDGRFPTAVVWTIADDTGDPVGLVQLNDIHWIHRTAQFGIWVGPEHWGHGHAGRATRMACDHAFGVLGLRQLRPAEQLRLRAGPGTRQVPDPPRADREGGVTPARTAAHQGTKRACS